MPTVVQNLDTAILNISGLIAQITVEPKPSYNVDSQLVSWAEYLDTLTTKLATLQKTRQMAGGPYQRASRFRSV